MATLPHPPAGSLSILADETVFQIVAQSAYAEHESGLANPSGDASTVDKRITRHLCLTCRRFYRIAIEILWYDVVVTSRQQLLIVAQLSSRGGVLSKPGSLSSHTRRLVLNINEPYDQTMVSAILTNMPRLSVFKLATYASPVSPHALTQPRATLCSLTAHCREVKEVELSSPVEVPSPSQVLRLLDRYPHLESLSVLKFSQDSSPSESSLALTPVDGGRKLRVLSLGFALSAPLQTSPGAESMDGFISLLKTESSLPNLSDLRLFGHVPSMRRLLRLFGAQLRNHTLVASPQQEPSIHDRSFLDACPNLLRLTWIVTAWDSLAGYHKLPARHDSIQGIVIVLCLSAQQNPGLYANCIGELLRNIERGNYPALREVTLRPRGPCPPQIRGRSWYEALRNAFWRRRVDLSLAFEYSDRS